LEKLHSKFYVGSVYINHENVGHHALGIGAEAVKIEAEVEFIIFPQVTV
jgi:hypothetical protein